MKKVLHILPNAHLDPVWLWDWREGLTEGIATCRSMLKLMDQYPELTFIRGESSIYEHLEQYDPKSFARIKEYVQSGRWDLVGGNYVQPDTNLPGTLTFLKQYQYGKAYFLDKFGVDVKVAWAPDSFGHNAGMPEIYAACGFQYFAFTRQVSTFPALEKPVFYWQGSQGSKILTLLDKVGWYGSNRGEILPRLDAALEKSESLHMQNIAIFIGLGNHGGGTSQRMIDEILRWQDEHNEVEVRFSTLSKFFAACEAESSDYPTFQGEINFCLRGCSSSAAKVKSKFRQCEAAVRRAELVGTALCKQLDLPELDLETEWKGLLFNTFHDILPGSSIDRANEEQIEWMDGIIHSCRRKEFELMNALALSQTIRVETPEYDMPCGVPFVLFNPRSEPYLGPVELEFCMDYRPSLIYEDRDEEMPVEVCDEMGQRLPFQKIAAEHNAMARWPWRRRVVIPEVSIPATGQRQLTLTHVKAATVPELAQVQASAGENFIANEFFRVEAFEGQTGLKITRNGVPVLAQEGLKFALFEDRYGSWGGMAEEEEAFTCPKLLEVWQIKEVKILESGPVRSSMFVHFAGKNSQARLIVNLYAHCDYVECKTLVIYQDRGARLRLVMDSAESVVTYQIPGGSIERSVIGDVPGGRWLKLNGYGIASDHFCGFTSLPELYAVNLIRGCRSASDEIDADQKYHERPITDYGSHKFNFAITGNGMAVEEMAERIELPLLQIMSWPHEKQ